MENILIKFIGLFRKVYESAGINFDQLQAIVRTKLMMDNRRGSASFIQGRHQSKESNSKFVIVLVIYALLGAITSVFMGVGGLLGIAIVHSFILTFLALTLVSDYSSVLLDTADMSILMPRPVDSKTLFAARLTHISLYVGLITLAISFVPMIVAGVKYGMIGCIIFFISALLMGIFAVFFTSLIYLLLFRFTSEERLRDIINYVQIGMAIFFYAGSQIFPRLFRFGDFKDMTNDYHWWHYLLPPMWMSAPLDAYVNNALDVYHLILITECVVMPIMGLWVVNRYFSPYFNEKLAILSTDTEGVRVEKKNETQKQKATSDSLISRISAFITSSPVENGAFNFVWYQLGRDRKLKLRLYPQMAYSIVMLVILSLPYIDKNDFHSALNEAAESKIYLMYIYLGTSMILGAMQMIAYSDDYKAAWIYYALPIEKPGEILLGTHKALIMRFMTPICVIVSIFLLFVWGYEIVDDLVFGYINVLIISLIVATEGRIYYPFSEALSGQTDSGNVAIGFLMFFFFGVIGGIHYVCTFVPYLILGLIPVQLFIVRYLLKKYRNIPNRFISSAYE